MGSLCGIDSNKIGVRTTIKKYVLHCVIGHEKPNRETESDTKKICLKARRASGQTPTTCSKSDVREHARCADAQVRRRAKRTGARSTQACGARRRAGRASARSTQARGARRQVERASARSMQARGRAGAFCSRPSGPAFLFSFGRARKFADRCRGGGAPGVGPQGHRASPAPKDSRQA